MSAPLAQRRMTSPASLALPEHSDTPSTLRPPSPLRNAFTSAIDADDSEDDDSDNNNSPTSVSHLAASFANRVGSFVAATRTLSTSSNNHLPTDAELQAEAHRERERSRREAELILTREAEERRMAEEKILAMRERREPLPPPPSRVQTISNPSSPSGSPKSKDGTNWWTAAKNRLTPTKDKDPLTPAQQVILDAKAREKEKGKESSTDLNLNLPYGPPSRPIPTSPVSPTPSRNQAPNLTPSPMRSTTDSAHSPSREAPPLYAQFTPQGTLDVHGTLLTIVNRFEKLEKWTVGHVRALEDRMNDVERWLVEKEREKEKPGTAGPPQQNPVPPVTGQLNEIREELGELQGRVTELGREMAKMSITTSSQPSPPPPPQTPRVSSTTVRESTSPPIAAAPKRTGTRLPYPTGDYASPPDNLFSPPHSPPGSVHSAISPTPSANAATTTSASRPLPTSPKSTPSASSLTRVTSPPPQISSSHSLQSSSSSSLSLPPPKIPASSSPASSPSGSPRAGRSGKTRQSSVSPTPRKRYTVALGEPIVNREPQPQPQPQQVQESTSTTPTPGQKKTDPKKLKNDNNQGGKPTEETDEDDGFQDETIGKSQSSKILTADTTAPPLLKRAPRVRPQSVNDFNSFLKQHQLPQLHARSSQQSLSSNQAHHSVVSTSSSSSSIPAPVAIAPLSIKSRWRSQSTDRGSLSSLSSFSDKGDGASATNVKFVGKQEREKGLPMPKSMGKIPVGDLVAFFDGEKRG